MKLMEIAGQYVYHGTSETAWQKIQKSGGLSPQKNPDSFFRGNLSTIAGITEKQIYLSGERESAEYYAREQGKHGKTESVLLKIPVSALDIDKCFPDDDHLIVLLANDLGADEDAVIKMFNDPTSEFTERVETKIAEWRKRKSKFSENFAYQGTIKLDDMTTMPVREYIPPNYDF